jgi:transposase InsO family protein
MVRDMLERHLTPCAAAAAHGVSAPIARKWLGRYLARGEAGLANRSSRPACSPRAIAPAKALAVVELRRRRLTQARIARDLRVSLSTVSRVLARAGLSKLRALEPAEPIVRYEHAAPGELLHIDIKKLGRIGRPGHRVTGNRPRRAAAMWAGNSCSWPSMSTPALDSPTCIRTNAPSAVQFLHNAVAYHRALGVRIRRVLTDNGAAFHSKQFRAACRALHIAQCFTRPYRPQTNGKAERFIQSALREWAGRMPSPTKPRSNAPPHSIPGFITKTGIAHTKASAAVRLCVDSLSPKTTS